MELDVKPEGMRPVSALRSSIVHFSHDIRMPLATLLWDTQVSNVTWDYSDRSLTFIVEPQSSICLVNLLAGRGRRGSYHVLRLEGEVELVWEKFALQVKRGMTFHDYDPAYHRITVPGAAVTRMEREERGRDWKITIDYGNGHTWVGHAMDTESFSRAREDCHSTCRAWGTWPEDAPALPAVPKSHP